MLVGKSDVLFAFLSGPEESCMYPMPFVVAIITLAVTCSSFHSRHHAGLPMVGERERERGREREREIEMAEASCKSGVLTQALSSVKARCRSCSVDKIICDVLIHIHIYAIMYMICIYICVYM